MGKASKRKADELAAPAPVCNPLRDRALLEAATRELAAAIVKQKRKMTAMAFCVEVLRSLKLHDIAIGQAERITISGFRKTALGAKDSEMILKPAAAAPVVVPHLRDIMGTCGAGPAIKTDEALCIFRQRLDARLDCDALRKRSLVHIRAFLSPGDAKQIVRDLWHGGAASSERATALRESSGTGRNGAYGDVQLAKSAHLKALLEALTATLKERLGCPSLGTKVVCTRYGPKGVNYAHQDQSEGGYQAYLLLSEPKKDFNGGELYIVDPAAVYAGAADHTRCEPWQDVGDLVVFAANAKEAAASGCGAPPRAWLHGFKEVTSGTREEANCHLCVVGLME